MVPKISGVTLLPPTPVTLTQNLADLRPRNHLYVTAGAKALGLNFPLDTSSLADGYHELTAVAYEGSHVRTQTRATLPVIIQNTSLSASMTMLDLPDTAPAQGRYRVQVTASPAHDISTVTLRSTGGPLGTVTNQSTAVFEVDGASLGVGRHPFYTLVHERSGLSYRTETKWVRFVNVP